MWFENLYASLQTDVLKNDELGAEGCSSIARWFQPFGLSKQDWCWMPICNLSPKAGWRQEDQEFKVILACIGRWNFRRRKKSGQNACTLDTQGRMWYVVMGVNIQWLFIRYFCFRYTLKLFSKYYLILTSLPFWVLLLIFEKLLLHLFCMRAFVRECACTIVGQLPELILSSLYTLWVLGIEFRSSDLVTGTGTHWTVSWPLLSLLQLGKQHCGN